MRRRTPHDVRLLDSAEALDQTCLMNIWAGDVFKDIPADRMGPRVRYQESIDEIRSETYDVKRVKPCAVSSSDKTQID